MEKTKGIKAIGMIVYFIILNLLFLAIANGIAGSNLGDLVVGYEKNSVTFDGSDFSALATSFSGIVFLTMTFIGLLVSVIVTIIAFAISNAIFNSVYFKNNKYTKEILLKDLNTVNLPIVIISLINILVSNIHSNIVLLIIGTVYYIAFWLISYLFLKSKINKVTQNN